MISPTDAVGNDSSGHDSAGHDSPGHDSPEHESPEHESKVHDATLRRYEATLAAGDEEFYELTLFVSGASDIAARTIANAKTICEVHLRGRHQLSIVDVYQDPSAAVTGRLLAIPTLIRNRPLPPRRIVGDLSHTAEVLRALDLPILPRDPTASG